MGSTEGEVPETASSARPRPTFSGMVLPAMALLFFLSGSTSLIYEVAWVKVLTLQLGCSSWSIAIVVSSFMAGLGSGSAWAGRRAGRLRRPLRAYAYLELGIALFGFISSPVIVGLGGAARILHPFVEPGGWTSNGLKLLLAFAVLLPPTFLMGATLPVLSRWLAGEEKFRQRVSAFYSINTFGACGGALLAGLFLLPSLGLSSTIGVSAFAGLLIAAAAFWLDRLAGAATEPDEARAVLPSPSREARPASPAARHSGLLLGGLAISGAANIACQIAWTRLLIPVVGSSTYAFTIILATFLLGLALGGLAAAFPLFKRFPEAGAVGALMVLTSLSVLGGLPLINQLPEMFIWLAAGTKHGLWGILLSQAALAAVILLLPTVAMGAALPLAFCGRRRQVGEAPRAVGAIYCSNTLGAIAGSVLCGFVLLPSAGAGGALRLASVTALLAGLVLISSAWNLSRRALYGWGACLTCGLFLLAFTLPAIDISDLHRGVYRYVLGEEEGKYSENLLLYVEDGRNSTVTVFRSPDSTYLKVNGKTDASTAGDLDTQYLLAHLPLFLHAGPHSVCIIGFGSGGTAYATTTHPGVESVEVVEIEEAVVEAAPFFQSVNHDVQGDPRVRIHFEDGRIFLSHGVRRYDVIISEPSNPWMAGVSSLFTEEFYRAVRSRLNPGGRFCQWVPIYGCSRETLQVVLHTLATAFPHVGTFLVGGDLICVASAEPLEGDPERYRALFAVKGIRDTLERIGVHHPYEMFFQLLRSFPANRDLFLAPLCNTDDNMWLEHRAPLEMYRGTHPEVPWLSPKDYLANVSPLFPGEDAGELALNLARAMVKREPALGELILAFGPAVEADEELTAELKKQSDMARARLVEVAQTNDRLKEAIRFLSNREFSKAVEVLERILSCEPDHGTAHRLIAWALLGEGNVEEGLKRVVRALEIQPDDYESQTRLGSIFLMAGKKEGEGYFRKATVLNPAYGGGWEGLAKSLVRQGERDRASAVIQEAKKALSPADFKKVWEAVRPELEGSKTNAGQKVISAPDGPAEQTSPDGRVKPEASAAAGAPSSQAAGIR